MDRVLGIVIFGGRVDEHAAVEVVGVEPNIQGVVDSAQALARCIRQVFDPAHETIAKP